MADYAGARSAYDKVGATQFTRPAARANFQKALVCFLGVASRNKAASQYWRRSWSRRVARTILMRNLRLDSAGRSCATDLVSKLEQLRALEVSVQKPLPRASESRTATSPWLRCCARKPASQPPRGRRKLPRKPSPNLETQRGYHPVTSLSRTTTNRREVTRLLAQGDFAQHAADELAGDPHSPLVLQQLVLAQEKLGNNVAAESTRGSV